MPMPKRGSSPSNQPRQVGKHASDKLGSKPDFDMPESTAKWGGLPGGTQPRSRSGGDRKVKIHPKSEGI